MRLFVLLISVAGLMALVFFGLSVLLINIVGWLWPTNSSSRLDRVIVRAGRHIALIQFPARAHLTSQKRTKV